MGSQHPGIEFERQPVSSAPAFQCCLCSGSFADRGQLLSHLSSVHRKPIQKDYLHFDSKSDFQGFVDSIENVRFVNRKGAVSYDSKNIYLIWYAIVLRSRQEQFW
jgi:hypothetical protein